MLRSRLDGDKPRIAAFLSAHTDQPWKYALHGGAVPVRVRQVEGIVAVVTVSVLQQAEDHGVIMDVVRENWGPSA